MNTDFKLRNTFSFNKLNNGLIKVNEQQGSYIINQGSGITGYTGPAGVSSNTGTTGYTGPTGPPDTFTVEFSIMRQT